jgi:hypothetical protein
MISQYILRALKYVLFAVLFVATLAILGFVVKGLWNWLMPTLFGWKLIGYWQAVGLIILCKILFGGFRGSRARGGYRHRRLRERWGQRRRKNGKNSAKGFVVAGTACPAGLEGN